MKTVKLVFGLIMVLALISGPSVVAQEVDPPREEGLTGEAAPPDPSYGERSMFMTSPPLEGDLAQREADKQRELESFGMFDDLMMMDTVEPPVLTPEDLMGPDLVMPDAPMQEELLPPTFPLEKEDEVREVEENDTRAVSNESGLIYIASSFDNEYWPSVAHGGNYYMAVYAHNGNIYAKFYSNSGAYQNTHTVADWSVDCGYPAVAYEAKSGLFLVAYEYYYGISDHDIYVQAVSPITGKVGVSRVAGSSLHNEWYPNVACNPISGSCLVAYQHNQEYRIKGKFFTLSSTGIPAFSSVYDLTGSTESRQPYLVWGKGTGYYMLVYNYWDGSKNHPYYNKLYQAPVPSGNQYLYYAAVVDPSNASGINNKFSSGVAYDPCTEKFVVAFYHDFLGSGSDYDVWAVAKLSTDVATGFIPFSVAFSDDNERNAAISFVTDSHLPAKCGSMDKLVVAYVNTTLGVKAADLRGNNSTTAPAYTRDGTGDQLVVIPKTGSITFDGIYPVSIASGSSWARMFIAGQPKWTTSPYDYDIWGRLVQVRTPGFTEPFFLPLVVR